MNRREFLGITAGAGATLALTPELLRALQQSDGKLTSKPSGKLLQRAIPSSGEMLPVISFGARPSDPAALKEILKALLDNGGRVVDVLHGGPAGEQGARTAAEELGIQNKFFWTTPLSVSVPTLVGYDGPPLKPDAAAVKAAVEAKFATFKVPKIDLVMVGTNADMPLHLAVLREMKKEGRVRYIGVHHLAFPPNAPQPPFGDLESIMRDEPIDFVGTDYSVGDPPRRGEDPAARPGAEDRLHGVLSLRPPPYLRAREQHAPSGVGRRFRRQDVGAVLPQVRHQPPGRHRGPHGDDQSGAHDRQHRRRHRPPAERGDAEAHGGVGGRAPPDTAPQAAEATATGTATASCRAVSGHHGPLRG
jgi:hypothetical protein